MNLGKRSRWKKYLSSPITLVILVILTIIVARSSSNIGAKSELSYSRLAQAQAEYEKLQLRHKELSVKVTRLSSEEGLESEIRAKYRAVREGESVAVILDETTTTTASLGDLEDGGWLRHLLRKFGF